jgi:hypothetical protein
MSGFSVLLLLPWLGEVCAQEQVPTVPTPKESEEVKVPAPPYKGVWEVKTYKVPAANIVRVKGNRVYPHPNMPVLHELVAVEGEWAIIRQIPPEDPDSPLHRAWLKAVGQETLYVAQREYLKDKFLVMEMPEPPADFVERLAFTEVPGTLPRQGQWQMSFDVADMNGDGRLDIVLPPARGGEPWPTILLQDKDGSFAPARAFYAPEAKLDYGAVRVADFDGNGAPDLALACHFGKHYVLYNEGNLTFSKALVLPTAVAGVSARSLTLADFNGDGRPDLASLAELDMDFKTTQRYGGGLVNVFLNLPQGWEAKSTDAFNKGIMGDWLTAGDLNGDGLPDLFLTSRAQGVMDLVYLNEKKGERWRRIAELKMPVNGFSFANALGRFDSTKGKDLILCFEQFNPKVQEDPTQACVVYHFHDKKGAFTESPEPQLVFREKKPFLNYQAVAVGDLDGDGRDDVVVGNEEGTVRVFLQLSPGRFFENKPPLKVAGPVVDLKIADFNRDGLGDLVVMSTTGQLVTNGGLWVFRTTKKGLAKR